MTAPEERAAEIKARRERHSDLLDVGGTETALIGGDIDWLLDQLATHTRRLEEVTRIKEQQIANVMEDVRDAERRLEEARITSQQAASLLREMANLVGIGRVAKKAALDMAARLSPPPEP